MMAEMDHVVLSQIMGQSLEKLHRDLTTQLAIRAPLVYWRRLNSDGVLWCGRHERAADINGYQIVTAKSAHRPCNIIGIPDIAINRCSQTNYAVIRSDPYSSNLWQNHGRSE